MSDGSDRGSVIVRFLDQYRTYSSYGHLFAAQSLQETIKSSRDRAQRKLLAVKVYAEYVAAMEDLGALCIAIKHCNDKLGLIHAYLTYGQRRNPNAPSTQIREIFELMQQGDALASALELPPLEDILSLDPALRDTMLPELYRQANILLAMVSNAYLADEGAYVRAYNKTKHGFVVVDDPNLFGDNPSASEDDRTWIVADNPAFSQRNLPPDEAPIELYDVSLAHVDPMVDQIATIRGAVEVLCRLVIYLLEQDAISATFHQHG